MDSEWIAHYSARRFPIIPQAHDALPDIEHFGIHHHFRIDIYNRGENKNDVGVMYVISNALRTKILTKNGIKKY